MPIAAWGVRRWREPSMCDWKRTPSSSILFILARLKTWKPPAVRQNRAIPAHEFVKPAQAGDSFVPRAQVEVIGISKNDLRVEGLQLVGGKAFDGPGGTDRHEYGSIDRAAGGFDPPGTCAASRIC